MQDELCYRELKLDEISNALSLIWDVFLEFEAPEYSTEGLMEFWNFLDETAIRASVQEEQLHFTGCFKNHNLVGVIAMKENRHICMLFVDRRYHKNGIARKLFTIEKQRCLKNYGNLEQITVNSSPYAVLFYQKLGFIKTDEEQTVNGIRFTPMKLNIR